MQNYDKVVARRFLVRISGRLHGSERRYRRFVYKRQFLEAGIHDTKGNVKIIYTKTDGTNFG